MPGILALACACEPQAQAEHPVQASKPAQLVLAGTLDDKAIDEASGIVASLRDPGVLWLHNDDGKPRLFAIDHAGRSVGRLTLEDTRNNDWEDIAAYVQDGVPYLLVADVGDNDAKREYVSLLIVEEPDLSEDDRQKATPARRIDFTYPDGPRDAEAVATDVAGERAYILTKRDLPPRVYSLPLTAPSDGIVEANLLGPIDSLPPPNRQDVEFAPQTKDWHWQPTGMDFARDGSAAVVLTYSTVYYFERAGDWFETLSGPPLGFGLRGTRNAEAIAFAPDSRSIFITTEKKYAPLLRIDMTGDGSE